MLGTKRLFEGKTFNLRQDRVQIASAEPVFYEYEERAKAVIIVPVTSAGAIVLIRQYRYPVDAWCLETPAGGCHDTGSSPLEEVVRKELTEEIGATVETVEHVGRFYSSPSFSNEECHIYLAWNVELSGQDNSEQTEAIELVVVPAPEAMEAARNGGIITGPCALALLRCEQTLRSRGFLRNE